MLTSWWLLALMSELKILAGLLNVLLLVAGNLLFKDHYCIFPTVNILQTMLRCSKSNSQMMKRLFQSRTTEGKRRRKKIKRIWQLTYYLCRYPWGTSTPASPPLSSFWLSLLSVSGGIKSLSHEGLAEIIPVSHRRLDGAEMPHYQCSKGYSKFNGAEVVH